MFGIRSHANIGTLPGIKASQVTKTRGFEKSASNEECAAVKLK